MSIFSKTQFSKKRYSKFNLSHQRKFSCNMGELIPCLLLETVPGDIFDSQTAQLVRFAPMIAPMMHQVSVYTHYFYVPNRILWDDWEDFITGGEDGTADPQFPTVNIVELTHGNGSLVDYMGIPPNIGFPFANSLPFMAYQMVYNEYFRDQNLIPKVADKVTVLGGGDVTILEKRRRAWQHDYFTSALPWTQKGAEVTIPLGQNAPVVASSPSTFFQLKKTIDDTDAAAGTPTIPSGIPGGTLQDALGNQLYMDPAGSLVADLSNATAAGIRDLRNAFRLQEWLELNARGGSRYIESIMVHFGVNVGDGRVNRPEFLGGGSTPISVSEVLQTSSTDATTPQANMAGHAISAGQSSNWRYKCKEHGWIIGILSIMPKTAYQQGIHRQWFKFDKFDYFWSQFAHVGEQEIYNKEIYWNDDTEDDNVFGYTPRYAEYKFISDTVHGEYRGTLDFWHMGRKFATRPVLNQTFIECNPTSRIFANPTGEQCYIHMYHNIKATRQMPYFAQPKI